MQKLIASYLFQNKTCPLPGLGTLSVLESGAEADFGNKSIAAPKQVIQFVNAESDTAGLVKYLSDSADSGNEMLEQFCVKLKKEIADHANANLEGIGNLFVDRSGNIGLKPEELNAIFFQSVFADRVTHPEAEHHILVGDKETTNTVMNEFLNPVAETKDRWWIWAIVLGTISLLLLLIYFTEGNGNAIFGNGIKI